MKSVYDARDPAEGCRLIIRALPSWFIPTTISGIVIGYALSLELRLLLARWRNAQRNKIMEKYRSMENREGSRASPEMDMFKSDTYIDSSQVSYEDVEEFRISLGLVLPRDDDLVLLVEKMLIHDPIPKGWELYRCTFGGLRFRNVETDDVQFFHDGAKEIETKITSEVKKRDDVVMSKYGTHMFHSNVDENEKPREKEIRPRNRISSILFESVPPSHSSVEPEPKAPTEDTVTNSFQAVFNYFINKEKNALENEMSQSFAASRKSSSYLSGTSRESRGLNNNIPNMRVSNNVGLGSPLSVARRRLSTPDASNDKWSSSSKPPLAPR